MKKHINNNERGVALLFVLFALLLLTAIAAGLMFMSDTESGINLNYRAEQQAYFGAVAGLQEARQRLMRPPNGDLAALLTTMPTGGAPTGVIYITNPNGAEVVQPWTPGSAFVDDELCHELFPLLALSNTTAPNVPCPPAAPAGLYYNLQNSNMAGLVGADRPLNYKWVRITLKQNVSSSPYTVDGTAITNNFIGAPPAGIPSATYPGAPLNAATQICWDGVHQILKPAGYVLCDDNPPPPGNINMYKPVYVLTSLAVTPSGARRMMQMEAADNPPLITNAALDTDDFVTTSGSSVTVNGFDNCQCDCPLAQGGAKPVCTNRTTGLACTGSTYAIFTSETITTQGNPAIVAGTPSPTAEHQKPFPYDVASLITKFSNVPGVIDAGTSAPYNFNCTPPPSGSPAGTPSNCGTTSSDQFGNPGDPFPPPSGIPDPSQLQSQVTYIPGSIDLQAHSIGAGVLIVDGDLTIHGGLNFYGLILVRGVIHFAGGGSGQDTNILGSVLTGQGSSVDTLQGGVNLQYDRCALLSTTVVQPPAVLSAREVTY